MGWGTGNGRGSWCCWSVVENFRLRHQLEAGLEAAKRFWRAEVLREGGLAGMAEERVM